jgi:glutathione synthase/RimK-type ligase-like ATP-grasp enzyme
MRILLTEGSGLTSRQVTLWLARAGHIVDVVSSDPWCLARFTRHVRRLHAVPCYGEDPWAWLEATLEVYRSGDYDLLLPTHEQVAVLARSAGRSQLGGVCTVVPEFSALLAVQDKVSAAATLDRCGIAQPPTQVVRSLALDEVTVELPAYVKLPIGTATSGVRRVADRDDLRSVLGEWAATVRRDGVVVQSHVEGTFHMVQAVFDRGVLRAAHANERVQEGARGGASHKRGVRREDVCGLVERLGTELAWHGALSADVIDGPDGPVVIDVNPRIVEPANAWCSGVDLVGELVTIATGRSDAAAVPAARDGVRTHQFLLAVLGAAQHAGTRRAVWHEVYAAARGRGSYRTSTEELTPWRGDPRTTLPVAAAVLATLARPATWTWFSSGSVASYAMGPGAWAQVCSGASE